MVSSPKIVINLLRIDWKLNKIEKENHIGSAVSDILQYTHTDTDPVTLFIRIEINLIDDIVLN